MSDRPRPVIALLTDFGLQDHFVGVMKGVIARICPAAHVIDITHAIEPQSVAHGAFVLEISRGYFPPETVFVGVVDPGVGTNRRPLAARMHGSWFVGPDNGLFSWIWEGRGSAHGDRIIVLENQRYWLAEVSSTFHGRDVFAPVAAHLAAGIDPADLGPEVSELVRLERSRPQALPDGSTCLHVLHVDRFGNLITDLRTSDLPNEPELVTFSVGDFVARGVRRDYATADELVAVAGSAGYVELAAPGGSAAQITGAGVGATVVVRLRAAARGG